MEHALSEMKRMQRNTEIDTLFATIERGLGDMRRPMEHVDATLLSLRGAIIDDAIHTLEAERSGALEKAADRFERMLRVIQGMVKGHEDALRWLQTSAECNKDDLETIHKLQANLDPPHS